jgi:hypothetical protein
MGDKGISILSVTLFEKISGEHSVFTGGANDFGFWILDLRFWIDRVHKGAGLGDFRLSILGLFRPQGAGS